ncbi:hypothetical protein Tco_1255447 [Tanacetum coccineum]
MIAYLQKSEGSEGFHQIIDFLNASHIQYALIENPTIYVSFIKQFWRTATARTSATGEVELIAIIEGQEKTITEGSLRRHLKLEDNGGVTTLPNSDIFEQLALMGYTTDSDKLTFQKDCEDNSQSRRRTRVVLSDEKEVFKDPSKQARSLIEELDLDADISLVPPHDAEIQEKINSDTEVLLEEEETNELIEEPTEIVEDQRSGEKGEQEVTTVNTTLNTDSVQIMSFIVATLRFSTAVLFGLLRMECLRRGKIKIDEEERKKIARDAEIAKQLQEEYDKAGKKEAVAKVDTTYVIDWNDPSIIRYHALQHRPRSVAEVRKNMIMYLKNQGGYKMKDFKGMSYNDIRPIFEKVWDQVHSFVPMDSEEEVQRLKRAGQDVEAKPVPDEGINVEALQTKYPIIGWEVYSEDTMQFWKIIRVGNHTEVYQVFEDMLKNFDRDDLIKLWSLVQERYNSSGLTEDKEIEL